MKCSEVFLIPSFIISSFCFDILLCCLVVEVYARWKYINCYKSLQILQFVMYGIPRESSNCNSLDCYTF